MAGFSIRETQERGFQPRTKIDYEELWARLRSEYGPAVPSETELAGAFEDVDKDLNDCDAEIFRLQSLIIVLQNQRDRLEEYKSCLRSLARPIRRLPSEILARIFGHTCVTNAVFSRNLKQMPALALSGVCSRWRAIARSYSVLWSNIRLDWRATDPWDWLVLKHHLACSNQSPLSIEIVGARTEIDLPPLAIISEHSHRWRRLHIEHAQPGLWLLQNHPTKHFPLLEAFEAPNLGLRSLGFFQNAPRLQRFAAGGILSLQTFPWQRLTRIDFSYVSETKDMSTLLKACHALTEIRLRESGSRPFRRGLSTILTPALEVLSLELCQTSHTESLANEAFASITSPSLTSLHIHGRRFSTTYTRTWPKGNLHSFLSRSSCHLTTLSIKHVPLSDTDLTNLLPILPSLLSLIIDDTNVVSNKSPLTSRFVKSLHAFRGTGISSALVPKLQSLSLTSSAGPSLNGGTDGFKDKDFVDMVSSRWSPDPRYAAQVRVACLRSVVLRLCNRAVDEEVYRPLDYMERAGMRIVVTGKTS